MTAAWISKERNVPAWKTVLVGVNTEVFYMFISFAVYWFFFFKEIILVQLGLSEK